MTVLNTKMKKIMAVALSCVMVIGAVAAVQFFGAGKMQPPSATEVPLNTKEVLSAVDGEEDGEANPELDVDPELLAELEAEEEEEARREAEREEREEAKRQEREEAEEKAREEAEAKEREEAEAKERAEAEEAAKAAEQEEIIVEAPLPEETAEPAAARSVTITSTLDEQIAEGDTIELDAELVGFDDVSYDLQWQYNDGSGWQDAENGNDTSYAIVANAQTVNYDWRIKLTISE